MNEDYQYNFKSLNRCFLKQLNYFIVGTFLSLPLFIILFLWYEDSEIIIRGLKGLGIIICLVFIQCIFSDFINRKLFSKVSLSKEYFSYSLKSGEIKNIKWQDVKSVVALSKEDKEYKKTWNLGGIKLIFNDGSTFLIFESINRYKELKNKIEDKLSK